MPVYTNSWAKKIVTPDPEQLGYSADVNSTEMHGHQ